MERGQTLRALASQVQRVREQERARGVRAIEGRSAWAHWARLSTHLVREVETMCVESGEDRGLRRQAVRRERVTPRVTPRGADSDDAVSPSV